MGWVSRKLAGRAAAVLLLVAAALVPLCGTPVLAQGCALCKTAAEAAGGDTGQTLNLAIVVLLIPTLSIFAGILLWAFRGPNRMDAGVDLGTRDPHLGA